MNEFSLDRQLQPSAQFHQQALDLRLRVVVKEACTQETVGFVPEELGDGQGVEIAVPCEDAGIPQFLGQFP